MNQTEEMKWYYERCNMDLIKGHLKGLLLKAQEEIEESVFVRKISLRGACDAPYRNNKIFKRINNIHLVQHGNKKGMGNAGSR